MHGTMSLKIVFVNSCRYPACKARAPFCDCGPPGSDVIISMNSRTVLFGDWAGVAQ